MQSVDLSVSLFEGICLLVFVALFRCCVATEAALTVDGFIKDPPVAPEGDDRGKLAIRHIPPPPLLYPPRFIFTIPCSVRSESSAIGALFTTSA